MSEVQSKRSENGADSGSNVTERPTKRARLSLEPEGHAAEKESNEDAVNMVDLDEEEEESRYLPEESRASDLYLDTVGTLSNRYDLCAYWRQRSTGLVWILTLKRSALCPYPTSTSMDV